MFHNQKAQALIEVTVAAGLAVIVISAITITTIIGLRNSQFAQNQIQATKYAQEGLEQIRNVQNRNCRINASNGTFYWYDVPTQLTTRYVWDQADFVYGTNFAITLDDVNCQMDPTTSGQALQNNRFFRKIIIDTTSDLSPDKIKVSAIVSWTDFSGSHKSQLVTILSRY